MILSASRRTDLPRFYFDWFLNRLEEGYVLVRNPMNHQQVSRIRLSPDVIDAIVFITKNATPMIGRLHELEPYPFFMHYTINPYAKDVERHLPRKLELVESFKKISEHIGSDRMVWRYSPILLSDTYTIAYHIKYFEELAKRLEGFTGLCRISYLQMYPKIASRMRGLGISDVPDDLKAEFTHRLIDIADRYDITVGGCGNMDVEACGLSRVGCLDGEMISNALGIPFDLKKDPGQRDLCSCMPSVEIGSYNTCLNGCVYCYANHMGTTEANAARHFDPASPMLCDSVQPEDVITDRKVAKLGIPQLRLQLM